MRILAVLILLSIHPIFAQVSLLVDVPENTPSVDAIFLAGDFQGWNPEDEAFRLERIEGTNSFFIKLTLPQQEIAFKFTRGSWEKVESTSDGSTRPNRTIHLAGADTLRLQILGWEDLFKKREPQSSASPQVQVLSENFHSPQLKRHRRIWVYLPKSYHSNNKSYPVIYMLDGQNLFDRQTSFSGEWQVDETMDARDEAGLPTAIVVGIDHGGKYRLEEYTPWTNSNYDSGKGEQMLTFITQELKPYIDQQFRTKPSAKHTAIIGSSLGGLMAIYAGLKSPEIFGKIGVLSPAYWINPEIFDFAQAHAFRKNLSIYQVMAIPEGQKHIDYMWKMDSLLRTKRRIKLKIQTQSRKEGGHTEAFWASELPAIFAYFFGE